MRSKIKVHDTFCFLLVSILTKKKSGLQYIWWQLRLSARLSMQPPSCLHGISGHLQGRLRLLDIFTIILTMLEKQVWICWLALEFPPIFVVLVKCQIKVMVLERVLSNSAVPRLYLLESSSHINSKQFVYKTCSHLGIFSYWTRNSLNNLLSYCGLID